MEDPAKITKDIENKVKTEFNARFERMDKDFERWNIRRPGERGSYEYMTSSRPKLRQNEISMVSNHPRTFSDDVQSILSSSERQIIVRMAETQGPDMREEIGKLERLLEYAFEKADERLINLLLPTFKESVIWHSIVRGWTAGRFLCYKEGKEVIFDFLPLDARWLVYWMGATGLLKSGYITSRSPEELEDEYGKVTRKTPWYKPWSKNDKPLDVIDYWEYENEKYKWNGVLCNDEWLKEPEKYKIDSMPVLISPVATRPPVRSESGNENEGYGDSIFAPNRAVDDLINKMGSTWATQAEIIARQPLINYYDEQGKELTTTVLLADAILNLPADHNKLAEVPIKEVSPTLVNLVNWLNGMQLAGSLPDIDIGKPPPSGTLYNLVQEAGNRVFNPQLRNLKSFYSNACRLIEEQLIAGGVGGPKIGKFKIKGTQKGEYYENEITPIDLKKPHVIKVEFTARTPWQQLDTYQIADMAKRLGLPDGFIQEYILKLPDPKGLGDLSAIEMAEHSPKLAMVRAIKALMKAGREEEARDLISDYNKLEQQEQIATMPPPEGAEETTPPVEEVA